MKVHSGIIRQRRRLGEEIKGSWFKLPGPERAHSEASEARREIVGSTDLHPTDYRFVVAEPFCAAAALTSVLNAAAFTFSPS